MATVSDLSTIVRSFLDDDSSSSERYGLTTDILPAMNSAISYLVAVFSAAFDSKQLKPEVLTSLVKAKVLTSSATGVVAKVDLSSLTQDAEHAITSVTVSGDGLATINSASHGLATGNVIVISGTSNYDGRYTITNVNLNSFTIPVVFGGDETGTFRLDEGVIWRILGIEPNPTASGSDVTLSAGKMASRLTLEQWNHAQENPFMRGSTASIPTIFNELAYTGPGRYFGDNKDYLLLRPASVITDNKVALYYLEKPVKLESANNNIQFPPTLHNLIVQKTIQYLSYQHSKDAKYFQVTDKEVKELIGLMNV